MTTLQPRTERQRVGDLPRDVGRRLAALRNKANMSQAAVAPKVRVDQSRISRIESSDVMPDMSEVRTYLDALGTDEARDYLLYLEKDWRMLPEPGPENPDLDAIWLAEQKLQQLATFEQERAPSGPVLAEMEIHRRSLHQAADFLHRLDHQIAFAGDIGVGKTTALCLVAGLIVPEPDGALESRVALETGGGRITVCEVHIKAGASWGLLIEPAPEAEIYRLVADLCEGLTAKAPGANPETAEKGLPRELDRALRNMAKLARALRKTPDGKKVFRDPARELADVVATVDELRSEFSSRLQLWKRTTRELWYQESSRVTPQQWLRDTFAKINNGRLETVSLPQRIDIVVPAALLGDGGFNLSFVDTRGVDGNAIRPDLQSRLDDARVLTVLCSSFRAAPDATMQGLIKHALDTGSAKAVSERTALLVLPRPGDAAVMRDEAGARVETDADGYELKSVDITTGLSHVGVRDLPVLFFNAVSDHPSETRERLIQLVKRMRNAHVDRIGSLARTLDSLVGNYEIEAASAVRRLVNKRLQIFVEQNKVLPAPLYPVHELVVSGVQSAHPRTVWASTRRSGSWYNLDVFYLVGAGAAAEAKRRSEPLLNGLQALLTNMLGDPELQTSHDFLGEVLTSARDWAESFLEAVRHAGQEAFRPTLQDAAGLWARSEGRWGGGSGYRRDVAMMIREWFADPERSQLHSTLEARVQLVWTEEVIQPLRLLCGA